jgi:hypothetical protein
VSLRVPSTPRGKGVRVLNNFDRTTVREVGEHPITYRCELLFAPNVGVLDNDTLTHMDTMRRFRPQAGDLKCSRATKAICTSPDRWFGDGTSQAHAGAKGGYAVVTNENGSRACLSRTRLMCGPNLGPLGLSQGFGRDFDAGTKPGNASTMLGASLSSSSLVS